MKNFNDYVDTFLSNQTNHNAVFVKRGADADLVDYLNKNSYNLHKIKVSNEIYGDCKGLVQMPGYFLGIFEFIPLIQQYIIINLLTGRIIESNHSILFHDVDFFLKLRPNNPLKGDFQFVELPILQLPNTPKNSINKEQDKDLDINFESDDLPF